MGQTQLFTSCFTTHSKYQQTAKLSILLGIRSSVQFKFHTVFREESFRESFLKLCRVDARRRGEEAFILRLPLRLNRIKSLIVQSPCQDSV